jgi:hypothetical protein
MSLSFHPVTPDRWPDLDRLFTESPADHSGNPSRCWCMEFRRPRSEWEANLGDGNRTALREIVDSGAPPGILAYDGDEPVGWCSISPRPTLPSLEDRGQYRNFQNPSVWVAACFYIRNDHRGQGVMLSLLQAAVEHVRDNGGSVVEGYPFDPETMSVENPAQDSRFMGFASVFREAGFVEVARGPEGRPVMRYKL